MPKSDVRNAVLGTSAARDGVAEEAEFLAVYRELRKIARRVRRSNPQATINTTALVHEAWIRLDSSERGFNERSHYLYTAALAMRQILVDYARYRCAAKRDRDVEVPLVEFGLADPAGQSAEEVLALEQALKALESLDQRAAQVVLLRFFAGVPVDEAADLLGISPRSAARDWTRAQAFLKSRLRA